MSIHSERQGPLPDGIREGSAVELHSVSKTYDTPAGEVRALRRASLQVRTGEFVAVMGPSGSGKSTLLGLIGGVVQPDAAGAVLGKVVVFGVPWSGLSEGARAERRRRLVAFVHQGINLLDFLTVEENVRLPMLMNRIAETEIARSSAAALSTLGLQGLEERRPRELSGGQQQRVAIARAMASGQPVLLADEPTGALDSKSAETVLSSIRRHVDDGGTALVASHNDLTRQAADRVLVLTDGELSEG